MLDGPVGQQTGPVPRAVDALTAGCGQEAQRGQGGFAPVAAGESGAGDVQLALRTVLGPAELTVVHRDTGAGEGVSDGQGGRAGRWAGEGLVAGAVHARLGDAVRAEDPRPRADEGTQPQVVAGRPALPAHRDQPHAVQPSAGGLQMVHQQPQERGGDVHHVHVVSGDEPVQILRSQQVLLAAQHQRAAGEQRPDEVTRRHVEREARDLEVAADTVPEPVDLLPAQVGGDEPAVGDLDALGPSGRSGGVDGVGEVVGPYGRGHRGRIGRGRGGAVDQDHPGMVLREPGRQPRRCHDHRRIAVLDDVREALPGLRGVEGYVRPARLPRRQDRGHRLRRPLQMDADDGLGADTGRAQHRREAVRGSVELAVTDGPAPVDESGRLGVLPDPCLESSVDQEAGGILV